MPSSPTRWIILATVFINMALLYGAWYAYSVFLVALLREFSWSRSLVAGGFSVFVLVHGGFSPLMGWLVSRVGPRRLMLAGGGVVGVGLLLSAQTSTWWHLYLFYGGVTAAGISLSGWIPSVLLVRGWFPANVGTAIGIASAGIGVGIAGLVPLTQILIDAAGWRWTFRILALLIVGWVVPASFWLIRNPASIEAPATRRPTAGPPSRDWTLALAVRDARFWALAGVFYTGNIVTQMLLVHQVAYLVDHGVSPLAAASVAGLVGAASIGGKLLWGWLSDRSGREIAYSLSFACTLASVGALGLAGRLPDSALPYVYGALIGMGYAGTAPVTPAAASDLFGGRGFSTIFGTLHTLLSIGTATGSWGAGLIFDRTGSYSLALWAAAACAVVAPTLMWLAAPRHPHPAPRRDGSAP